MAKLSKFITFLSLFLVGFCSAQRGIYHEKRAGNFFYEPANPMSVEFVSKGIGRGIPAEFIKQNYKLETVEQSCLPVRGYNNEAIPVTWVWAVLWLRLPNLSVEFSFTITCQKGECDVDKTGKFVFCNMDYDMPESSSNQMVKGKGKVLDSIQE